ncbi:TIGR02391 family protein [Microbacterium sp. ZW T5_45]|uniref:TIGR02391 family protein n=1 Tax=Microbacterium sp. ZW T5_45 TaxID=3378080 RepID=UPI003852E164
MSNLSVAHKTFLEPVLTMTGGYVLDFSNASFANFFRDLSVDIYDAERYPGFGDSKANRLRAFWKNADDNEVATSLIALADYVEAKQLAGNSGIEMSADQLARLRSIAVELAPTPDPVANAETAASFTTEATVNANRIQIEIHEDIYSHIERYLATGDYFHAVEESYKLVREKLRDITGKEKATDVFNNSAQNEGHWNALFGKATASSDAEKDFFRGIGYLHLGVQHLRNEKAHTPASPIDTNLAIHYIALASLAYDLITKYVSEELIQEIEELVTATRRGYSATRFYRAFEGGKWIDALTLPAGLASSSVRKVLKAKWLQEADFTRSYDHSNVMLMRLELVAGELTQADIDALLEYPTTDNYGNNQEAGMLEFLEYIQQLDATKISSSASDWMANKRREWDEN